MDQSRWAKNMENLSLSNNDREDDIDFDSPPKQTTKSSSKPQTDPKTPANRSQKAKIQASEASKTSDGDKDSRQDALRAELESVRRMNQVIEGVSASLQKARNNMSTTTQTVNNAHTLLDTWTRILSQTEHNQRLILNPAWSGASADLSEIENESMLRQRDAERREAEDAERRAAAEERRRQEEERRRIEAEKREASSSARTGAGRPGSRVGTRGRGVTSGRTTSAAGTRDLGADAAARGGVTGTTAGSGPAKVGRGAIAGYGRIGSAGTKPGRGRGRGVG